MLVCRRHAFRAEFDIAGYGIKAKTVAAFPNSGFGRSNEAGSQGQEQNPIGSDPSKLRLAQFYQCARNSVSKKNGVGAGDIRAMRAAAALSGLVEILGSSDPLEPDVRPRFDLEGVRHDPRPHIQCLTGGISTLMHCTCDDRA